jgi:quercetin dioxygenase-like cupin family protein
VKSCGDGWPPTSSRERVVRNWDLRAIDLRPHAPEILSSTDEARAVVLDIPAGESLQDHQVHERAWVTVIDGEVEVGTADGETVAGRSGLVIEFAPGERQAVRALSTTRLLPLLTPWPGDGHPVTMPLSDKATVRQRAAEHRRTR